MNGVHDMGGMHGLGPLEHPPNEPVFHAPWEARVFALRRAMGAWRKWNIDASRHAIEKLPASQYLSLDYFQRQFEAFLQMLVAAGFITPQEIVDGQARGAQERLTPAMNVDGAAALIRKGVPCRREAAVQAHFEVGQAVHTRNLQPSGHTRLPRYARDKVGTIDRCHGVFVYPDSNAHFLGEKPQPLYSVRFEARELWGPQASATDSVYLDLWEDYLEPA
ncbi:MAG TPA: nitrile hydratase subunit beta [Steroidobacteraceae bacterium]|jgi:nitrile hydratase beta subunit|nr:nitrile hydratase subunit beta [Steroidobacteraceae bacterium]